MVLVTLSRNPTLKGHKLLITVPPGWPTPQKRIDEIRQHFPDLEVVYKEGTTPEQIDLTDNEKLKDVTILLSSNHLPTIEQVPKLAYVQIVSAGANRILDDPLFTETEIPFCTASGVHGSTPDRKYPNGSFLPFLHSNTTKQGKWERSSGNTEDAVAKRVGILGYGSIGRQTARVATAMGMNVHAYTLHAKPTPKDRRDNSWAPDGLGDHEGVFPSKWFSGGSKQDLHDFLGSGLDLLVIALPLTKKTTGLIGREEFAILAEKKTFVSNIARGPIVVTQDLIDALEGDVIRGAALDVTDPEPLPEGHALWSTKNVIITPHVSGNTTEYLDRVLRILDSNLGRLSEDKELMNTVSRKDGY